jgi:hypothetical protein
MKERGFPLSKTPVSVAYNVRRYVLEELYLTVVHTSEHHIRKQTFFEQKMVSNLLPA